MPKIILKDVAKIYPFVNVSGLFNRKRKEKALARQKAMPYTSNEGVIALQHISLEIEDGEFVVVLGESGSGKSTLLRVIAGLERIPVGELYFDDQLMNDVRPEDRDVAMVFQNYALYPAQTVYENIAFPLQTQHLPRRELDQKVREIAELLHISDKLNVLPEDLSGGEKQRVAIGRALVRRPRIFLMDEPFANLDVLMRTRLRNEVKKLHEALGTTFIYVTHEQSEALALATRIIVLKDGILQQDAETSEVYNYPANRYVASLIGTPGMNFFESVKVTSKSGKRYAELLGEEIELRDTGRDHFRGKTVTVGIRPVNVELGKGSSEAEVLYTEMIGADLLIHLKTEEKEITAVEKMQSNMETRYLKGDKVRLSLMHDRLHFFDEDGQRIAMEAIQ